MEKLLSSLGQNVAIIGTQWGDEGKGKLVDALTPAFDIVCRSAGGANAGHTIVVDGKTYIFHALPSCMLHANVISVIGNGTVLHIKDLMEEIKNLESQGLEVAHRIKISLSAHLIFDYHKKIDQELEKRKGDRKIGTTGRGIGPCYTDKVSRMGIRCEDLLDRELLQEKIQYNCQWHEKNFGIKLDASAEYETIAPFIEDIKPLLCDTSKYLGDMAKSGKKIMFEGAQGHQLDLDHGTYPFVTSSSTMIGGITTGLGIGPKHISSVIGITKAYTTRVGEGPFPSELTDEVGEQIRKAGHEFGATTGRPRRCGWFDAVVVKNAIRCNSINSLNLTKLDVLSGMKEIKIVTHYHLDDHEIFNVPTTRKANAKLKTSTITLPGWQQDIASIKNFEDLPPQAQTYIQTLEEILETPINCIGVGADRKALIWKV